MVICMNLSGYQKCSSGIPYTHNPNPKMGTNYNCKQNPSLRVQDVGKLSGIGSSSTCACAASRIEQVRRAAAKPVNSITSNYNIEQFFFFEIIEHIPIV